MINVHCPSFCFAVGAGNTSSKIIQGLVCNNFRWLRTHLSTHIQPIRGQHPGHVITLDQSEARSSSLHPHPTSHHKSSLCNKLLLRCNPVTTERSWAACLPESEYPSWFGQEIISLISMTQWQTLKTQLMPAYLDKNDSEWVIVLIWKYAPSINTNRLLSN